MVLLENILDAFHCDTSYSTTTAAEIEFYLSGGDSKNDSALIAGFLTRARMQNLVLFFSAETGERQYEIATDIAPSPITTITQICTIKSIITDCAKIFGVEVLFAAKPYPNQPGCGLHIHVGLEDKQGNHPFKKDVRDKNDESPILLHAIGGLCATMLEAMIFFAPHENSYDRFTAELNNDIPENSPLRAHNNAPTTVSWGGNNRTTAIRIPASTLDPELRHIEHRVAGSDADPLMVMAAVLIGIHYGLTHQIEPAHKIWGNSYDQQYHLPLLPHSLAKAQELYDNGKIINHAMSKFSSINHL